MSSKNNDRASVVYTMPTVSSVLAQSNTLDAKYAGEVRSYRDFIHNDSGVKSFFKSLYSTLLTVFLCVVLLAIPATVTTGLILTTLNSSGVIMMKNQDIPHDGLTYRIADDAPKTGIRSVEK